MSYYFQVREQDMLFNGQMLVLQSLGLFRDDDYFNSEPNGDSNFDTEATAIEDEQEDHSEFTLFSI